MEEEKYRDLKRGERGAIISIITYIFLSILKVVVGLWSGSEALRADGLNNATDIVASIAVLIGLKFAQKPADRNHPYGHWKAETVASMVASFIMAAVGVNVVYEGIHTFVSGTHESPNLISAWIGLFSAIVMYFVYRYNRNLAREIKSHSVMAAAKDNLSDALVSIGTVVGILGAQLNLPWLDPLTAVLVGVIICKTAWEIFREASHHLTDGFDEEEIMTYKETILNTQGVKEVKDIKARNYGNNQVVDAVILVRSDLSLHEAHHISTRVENELKIKHEVYNVHVHVEPLELERLVKIN
ncbi:cation diffusion facilitator family transporter [Robertmurraya korlensis]|uniref:cation diffusion facilitator family transporter n=1 Tax=Robertmurraya korlensis TaxID=519977 RepID=UPI00203CD1BB|nr:cation diffusion facilitator family transporter [Robertmurraya korlensis]MCM3600774.1 cation diffusion facilitator family transporter [Robertmurraya korlensis]